jgi:hypothetical protein
MRWKKWCWMVGNYQYIETKEAKPSEFIPNEINLIHARCPSVKLSLAGFRPVRSSPVRFPLVGVPLVHRTNWTTALEPTIVLSGLLAN